MRSASTILLFLFLLRVNYCLSQTSVVSDSITVAVYPTYNRVSQWHKVFFGKNNRQIWATPVKVRKLYLSTEKGGLVTTELGGGKQTESLHLKDSAGNGWVLRTLQKYSDQRLPKFFKHTVVKQVVRDIISAGHPFSALTVPPMAEALGIPHTHPEIVYVADDPALGKYRKDFAGQVVLFEEHQANDGSKILPTQKIREKIEKGNDNRFDQRLLLRARLLDMVIGDWDRHEKQWRWIERKDSTGDFFAPMPVDRDKVFYTTSGVFLWFAAKIKPLFQGFKTDIKHVGKWNAKNQSFDRYFLNGLNERDWFEQVDYVQRHLTDSLITAAVKLMPASIYAISGQQITETVIARRNNLPHFAMSYYRYLIRHGGMIRRGSSDPSNVQPQATAFPSIFPYTKESSRVNEFIYSCGP